jgi:hypothetical protein
MMMKNVELIDDQQNHEENHSSWEIFHDLLEFGYDYMSFPQILNH